MKTKLLFLLVTLIWSFNAVAQTAYPAPDLKNCEETTFDLTQQTPIILGNQTLSDVSIGYHTSLADAQTGTNQIVDPHLYVVVQDTTTIYARVADLELATFATTEFDLIVVATPELPVIPDVTSCDSYVLPNFGPAVQYAMDPALTVAIAPGMVITSSQTIYYFITDLPCLAVDSFEVTILNTPVIFPHPDVSVCDSYVLPELEVGSYFTGPVGSGSPIFAGETITQTQTVYIFAENEMCSAEISFNVTIVDIPFVQDVADVVQCDPYILPPLPIGNYYTETGGMGSMLAAGTAISSSATIYIFLTNGFCNAEENFTVTIDLPSFNQPQNVIGCTDGSEPAMFDLQEVADVISASNPDLITTFYTTYDDAMSNVNPIADPSAYEPIGTAVYARTEVNDSECYTVYLIPLQSIPCTDNTISGIVRIDTDGNGCDVNDPPAANMEMTAVNGNDVIYAYTNESGEYLFTNVLPGDFTVNVITQPQFLIPATEFVTILETTTNATADFCLVPAPPYTDLVVNMLPLTIAQPGFGVSYHIQAMNIGNTTVSGVVSLSFDSTRLTFVSSFPAGVVSGNVLTIELGEMPPLSLLYLNVNFTVATPPTTQLGDVLDFTVSISTDGDMNLLNNTFEMSHVVVNSFDPNDMNVMEGPIISEAQADDYLHYLIRFQNIGDANAINVRVENTLDANLDWDTFEPVASSHDYHAERVGGEVTFRYNGINLPGTNDEPASHGYVAYRIRPVQDFAQGDVIINSAEIYFDFNEPILTNVVSTQIGALEVPEIANSEFVVYPNPASSQIAISGDLMIDNIDIMDVSGKRVMSVSARANDVSFDVSALEAGIYFVRIESGNLIQTKKLMVR